MYNQHIQLKLEPNKKMHVRVLAVVATLLLSGVSSVADADDCLAQPTQACLFDLAIETAGADHDKGYWMRSILKILVDQESLGFPQHQTLRAAFLTYCAETWADPSQQVVVLRMHSGLSIGPLMSNAPETAAEFAAYLMNLLPHIDPKKQTYAKGAAAYFFMFAGDRQSVDDLLETATDQERARIEREIIEAFLLQGRYQEAVEFIDNVNNPKRRDILKAEGVRILLKMKDYGNVRDLAGKILNPKVRSVSLSELAVAFAFNGRLTEAMKTLKDMKQENLDVYDVSLSNFALVHAIAGNRRQVELLNWSISNSRVFEDDVFEWNRALLAASAGRLGELLLYLQKRDNRFDYERALLNSGLVYLQSGQNDLSLLFLSVPWEFQREGLKTLGYLQTKQGDLTGALDTFERVWQLDVSIDEYHVFDDRKFALERLMLERQKIKLAIELAYKRQDSQALSFLATQIP